MEAVVAGEILRLGDSDGNNSMDVTVYSDGSSHFWVCDNTMRDHVAYSVGQSFVASAEDLRRLTYFLDRFKGKE
jgi:hypothetical protein